MALRNVEFRGKRADNGKWAEGCLDHNPLTKLTFIRKPKHIYTDVVMVLPETVGQYTGLTDKNGKKIFEGDVLRVVSSEYDYKTTVGPKNGYVFGFYVDGDFGDSDFTILEWAVDYWQDDGAEIEIIGNIHDNPELLGGADNG